MVIITIIIVTVTVIMVMIFIMIIMIILFLWFLQCSHIPLCEPFPKNPHWYLCVVAFKSNDPCAKCHFGVSKQSLYKNAWTLSCINRCQLIIFVAIALLFEIQIARTWFFSFLVCFYPYLTSAAQKCIVFTRNIQARNKNSIFCLCTDVYNLHSSVTRRNLWWELCLEGENFNYFWYTHQCLNNFFFFIIQLILWTIQWDKTWETYIFLGDPKPVE